MDNPPLDTLPYRRRCEEILRARGWRYLSEIREDADEVGFLFRRGGPQVRNADDILVISLARTARPELIVMHAQMLTDMASFSQNAGSVVIVEEPNAPGADLSFAELLSPDGESTLLAVVDRLHAWRTPEPTIS
ncbi:MAG: hypothetical protein NW206_17760 [Hyphomonadaceae bacterium]|nr:hypothetical protein [Hyphomonadaceae bacterium]